MKDVWLRGEEPKKKPLTLGQLIALLLFILFTIWYGYSAFIHP